MTEENDNLDKGNLDKGDEDNDLSKGIEAITNQWIWQQLKKEIIEDLNKNQNIVIKILSHPLCLLFCGAFLTNYVGGKINTENQMTIQKNQLTLKLKEYEYSSILNKEEFEFQRRILFLEETYAERVKLATNFVNDLQEYRFVLNDISRTLTRLSSDDTLTLFQVKNDKTLKASLEKYVSINKVLLKKMDIDNAKFSIYFENYDSIQSCLNDLNSLMFKQKMEEETPVEMFIELLKNAENKDELKEVSTGIRTSREKIENFIVDLLELFIQNPNS